MASLMNKLGITLAHLPKSPGVYRITNRVTGEAYIGGSANVRLRVAQHFYSLAKGKHPAPQMQTSYWQYGAKAFEAELVQECIPEQLDERETFWLSQSLPAFNKHKTAKTDRSALGQRKQEKTDVQRRIMATARTWGMRYYSFLEKLHHGFHRLSHKDQIRFLHSDLIDQPADTEAAAAGR